MTLYINETDMLVKTSSTLSKLHAYSCDKLATPGPQGPVVTSTYRILSKNLSQTVARKIPHSVTIRIGINKMAEGEEYLDCLDETLEQALACLFLW